MIYHTLGQPNESAENWDYFVFNDRDFTSVAELNWSRAARRACSPSNSPSSPRRR